MKKKYEIMAFSWPAIAQRKIDAGIGAAALVVSYKDKSTTIPLIQAVQLPIIGTTYQMTDPAALEEELSGIVEKMIGINKDLGFLAGHGTLTLTPDRMAMMQGAPGSSLQSFNSLMSQRYDIKPVDLSSGDIPDGLNCLIIAKPTEPFSDYELFQIDQALMRGTSIAFISDTFTDQSASRSQMGMPPGFSPIDTGLEKLLNHYGVSIKKAFVLDKQCYKHQQDNSGGEQNIYFAPVLKEATINTDPAFMKNIKGLIAMQISPVELIKDNIDSDNVTATRLFSSSKESWLLETPRNLNPMFMTPPKDEEKLKSYDLAYMLEGTFTSYFKGKTIPEKKVKEDDTLPGEDGVPKAEGPEK